MGNLIQASSKSIKGPFILDTPALDALHNALDQIVAKLDEGFLQAIEEKAESIIEAQHESGSPVITLEDARRMVRERSTFKKSKTIVELISSKEDRLKDTSVLNILKDHKTALLNQEELVIRFQRGPLEFRMEAVAGGENGGIDIEVLCEDESISSDIWHLIGTWVDDTSPNILLKYFSKFAPLVSIVLGVVLFFFLVIDFTPGGVDRDDQFQQHLADSARTLLSGGIDSSEISPALTILLEKQLKIVPDTFISQAEAPAPGLQKNTILVAMSFIIAVITPRTIIGLGKRRSLSLIYKYWNAVVIAWLPVSILLPWLIDKIF